MAKVLSMFVMLLLPSLAQARLFHRAGPHEAPPPVRVEVAEPRHGYVWVGGHHRWRAHSYEWVPGHYERERRGWGWRDGAWEQHDDHYDWHRGGWYRAR
ncbi:MAG TPA: hypothetical protein VNO55_10960 [Polyangia bacterium]|nr:hypothetical protein [Polyangia bacterium]